MIPNEFRKYLWDSKFESLDLHKNKRYIISRILEHGDLTTAKIILNIYSHDDIADVIISSTDISPRTAYFFKNYLNIKQPIKCLTMQLTKQQRKLWPY